MTDVIAMFGSLGLPEILVIAAVGLLLFGSRLPQVGRSLGRSIIQFKRGLHDVEDEVTKAADEDEPKPKRKLPASGGQEQPPAG